MVVCIVNSWAIALPTLWLRHLIRDSETKQRHLIEAKLAALHARINPHFLFNSLNTIASLIADKPTLAEETVERLANVFRHVLDTDHRLLVPLCDEVAFAKDILAIYGARFEDNLKFTIDIDATVAKAPVPSLIMQPLIENAILHGIAARGHGAIHVVAKPDDQSVILEIWDNGVGPGRSQHNGRGTGLADMRQKLALIYGNSATLSLTGQSEKTRALIRLPMQRKAPHVDLDR